MTDFVDATDPAAVEQVLQLALPGIGLPGVLEQLASVPGIPLQPWRRGGLFRQPTAAVLRVGDRALSIQPHGGARLEHIVGGVVLAGDEISPRALPGVLAAMVVRSLEGSGAHDELSVLLTAIRDAVSASG